MRLRHAVGGLLVKRTQGCDSLMGWFLYLVSSKRMMAVFRENVY